MKYIIFLLLSLSTIFGCVKPEIEAPLVPTEKILHIAYTRSNTPGLIHEKLRDIPLENYKMHLLGGDLDVFTSENSQNMENWDQLFNLSAETTLWTLGNHDINNRDIIEDFTKRPSFYTYTSHDITFLVLDTELASSYIIGDQLEMIKNVTDTLTESKNLIVLTHKLLWLQGNEDLEFFLETVPNGEPGDCEYCTPPNNFYEEVYDHLVNVQNRGTKVWCIAGDIGKKVTKFDYTLPEGIRLLASGVNITQEDNNVLELSRVIGEEDWFIQYKQLEEL